jgi:VanZ family protein
MSLAKKKSRIVLWILFLAFMSGVFYFSSQIAEDSMGVSGRVLSAVFRRLLPMYDRFPNVWQSELLRYYQNIIRKLAHFTEYAVLGTLLALLWSCYPYSDKRRILLSLGMSVLCACADEFLQLFILGRGARITDVGIDILGSVIGITMVMLFKHIINLRVRAIIAATRESPGNI